MTNREQQFREKSPEKKKRSIPHLIGSFVLLLAGAALLFGHDGFMGGSGHHRK